VVLGYIDLAPVPLFLGAVALICLAPGPDMAYLVGTGLAGGRPAAARAAFGITLGVSVYVAVTAAGLGLVVAAHPRVLTGLQVFGAGYLGWLAWTTWRESRTYGSDRAVVPAGAVGHSGQRWFRRGFIVNLTNPKIMLFFVAFLPQFLGNASSPTVQLLMLGLLLQSVGLVVDLFIGWTAGSFRARVQERPEMLRRLSRASAAVFAGLAVLVVAGVITHWS